jgi:hypothetical protein
MSLSGGSRIGRRTMLGWTAASATLLWHGDVFALEVEVPLRLQVDLLNRVLPYDRNFASRVHSELKIAIITDSGHIDSTRIGAEMLAEFHERPTLGGVRQHASRITFTSTQTLVDECRQQRVGLLYVTPGVRTPIGPLATALHGLGVLTVAAIPEQVRQGLVLGFAVRSGKPRLLVNLTQARQQQVNFRADFLRMAEVVG